MYASGYHKLFWGMMLITFNFHVGFLNLLPNAAGYLLIFTGLSVLETQYEGYKKGKPAAILLTLLTLKDIVRVNGSDLLVEGFGADPIAGLLLSSIITLVNLYLIFTLCRGVYELAGARGWRDLQNDAKARFFTYGAFTGLYLLLVPFSLNMPQGASVGIFILISVVMIVMLVFIAGLFRRAEKALADE